MSNDSSSTKLICRHDVIGATHAAAAHEDDDESFEPAADSNDPHHPDEQDHSEYVLDAREEDAEHGSKFLSTHEQTTHCTKNAKPTQGRHYRGKGLEGSGSRRGREERSEVGRGIDRTF